MSHDEDEEALPKVSKRLHAAFFAMHVHMLPHPYSSQDTGRLPLLFFSLSALDVAEALDATYSEEQKRGITDWIYALQVVPTKDISDSEPAAALAGFRGSPFLGQPFDPSDPNSEHPHDRGHIAMTYSALACLKILGDDYARVDREAVLGALKYLQREDGAFSCIFGAGESDMRFVYCACAIAKFLEDDDAWTSFDVERTVEFITSCQAYDGAFGLAPGQEGHGGSTYCAVSSLAILGRLGDIADRDALERWCVMSQGAGFHGRPNKPKDCCYSFWIQAAMRILGRDDWVNTVENRVFTLACQTDRGGFSKHPGTYPDLLHAYYGLVGCSMFGHDDLAPVDLLTQITKRAMTSNQ